MDDYVTAEGSEIRSLSVSTLVDGAASDVWSAWTTKAGIDSWWGPHDARVELRIGGPFEILFLADAAPGEQGADGCRILAYVPGEMLAFTWRATPDHPLRDEYTWVVVTFRQLDSGKTSVRLVHTGFLEGSDWDTYMEYFDNAWRHVLRLLAAHWAD